MQFLLQNEKLNLSHLLTPRGGIHTGLEQMILAPEKERLDSLARLKPVLPKLVIPETFYKIIMFQVRSGFWRISQTFEESNLKRIMA